MRWKREGMMDDQKNPKAVNQEARTVTDDQIVTERKSPRRSFLTATGVVLAAAAAMVSGRLAEAQEKSGDPDARKEANKGGDPDQKKAAGKKAGKKSDKKSEKQSDPDTKKKE
jgi:hypothetical protein